uniref:Putative type III secretion system protein OrgAb n=1 Tax=Candidatus Sodalis melophagi TaxID=1173031 RepID=I6PDR4_9GAMM|nr:putative type III secretion system protein OrgAb [Candidatus Sodalis melophagi]
MIKREHLQRQRCAMDLIKQARRETVKCLKQAAEEAERLRSQAISEGFQQGVLAAADAVADYLAERQGLRLSLQREVEDHARALLTAALSHADLLLVLLEEWLAQQPEPSIPAPLELWVPADRHAAALRLKRQIGALWRGKYDIITHDGESFIMKHGDQVAEFDAKAFIDAATRQMASCPDYGTKARRLSEQGLQALSDRLMRHFAGEHALPINEP